MLVSALSWKAQNVLLGKIDHFSPVPGGCCINARKSFSSVRNQG